MTYVAELVEEQLSIDPIHRVYRGVPPRTLRPTWPGTSRLSKREPSHRVRRGGGATRRAVPGAT